MPSWVMCPDTHKLVPKEEYRRKQTKNYHVIDDIEPFVSPVDNTVITSRSKLREHNERHGVTDSRDYSQEYYDKKESQRHADTLGITREARQERIQLIRESIEKHTRGR